MPGSWAGGQLPALLTVVGAVLAGAATWMLLAPSVPARRFARLRASLRTRSPGQPAARPAAAPLPLRLQRLWRYVRGGRERPAKEPRRRAAVTQLCFALAAELRAGRTPAEALVRAADTGPPEIGAEMAGVLTASRTGGDVAAALRSAGTNPGAQGLQRLAACWSVGAGTGAGFALAVERLAGALRGEQRHREDVAAQLAGPRSTARLLAALPLVGLVMSAALGMQPLDFLLGTAYGLASLGLGLGLDAAGLVWTHRLARRTEEGL